MNDMEFKDHTYPTGRPIEGSRQFRMIFSSEEVDAAREATRNAATIALQTGGFDAETAEETVELLGSLEDWRAQRYTTAERARVFATILRMGGPSLLNDKQSAAALRMATELESEATMRDAMQYLRSVQPDDFNK